MIFISKNEKGIPAWKLILEGRKTVTRRLKPIEVGKSVAVCPGRGKFAVCRIKILSCMDAEEWDAKYAKTEFQREAEKEGFALWDSLWEWIADKYGKPYPKLYRIEFEKEGSDVGEGY
jgi:hypothetical protein